MILRSFDHVGWLTWLKTADWKLDIDFCRNVFDMVTESFWDSAPHVNVREGKNKKRNSPFTFLKCCRNIFSVDMIIDLIIILWSHVQWVASSTVAVFRWCWCQHRASSRLLAGFLHLRFPDGFPRCAAQLWLLREMWRNYKASIEIRSWKRL